MAGRLSITPCIVDGRRLVAAAVLLAAAPTVLAQWCTAPPPQAGAVSAAEGAPKFRLIAAACPGLAAPSQVRHAEQLALFDRQVAVAITIPGVTAPAAAEPGSAPAAAAPLDRNGERVLSLAPALAAAAREHGIDPLLLHAIAHVESRHNPQAVSPAGARGLMQVMPATAQRFGVGAPERTLHDVETNLAASAAYLRVLRTRFGGDLQLMLAAYNAGEGAVEKYGRTVPPYPETQAYVRDVLAIHRRLSDAFTVSRSGALVARDHVAASPVTDVADAPAARGSQ
jgi:soluble lytic murein transglycosylase-like protein